jgi:NDP-sugar pyrophosphorylase family protein
MNSIIKKPAAELGYKFIPDNYIPKGKNEYHLRNKQNRSGIIYRNLSAHEIEVLVRNRNTADDWNQLLVSDAFNPELVKNCKFFGLVRIGKLEPWFLEFHAVRMMVGLYNSTIISCDFGDNVVIDNVNYLSHYIIGNEVMISNVHEMCTTNNAKFGNGILKEGEPEKQRVWLEVCNENAGRSIIPFNGMLPGDAWLWSRYRDNALLQQKLKDFTELKFDKQRGYYGKIGDRTVIKSCKIIKDVWVGSDAYLKGANKLKNLTINSEPHASSQVGEGCELVNGIMGEGCRVFYGVKAVRFYMASHSQLKYGARLINSYLGNNATISCCEVLNSLIFPAHEQHHNNSFLCAALVMGQSNIAAGATLGSNHNSRSADGELIAGRGFWPALCVSIKHNSKFATYTLLAKGDYPAELDIPFPFSLVSNDEAENRLVVMPGYWFMYNMYALARNAWKYIDRDKRNDLTQKIEYDFLAPDSINEMFESLTLLEELIGKAYYKQTQPGKKIKADAIRTKGKELLESNNPVLNDLEILSSEFENSNRKVLILKAGKSYHLFKELIVFYGIQQIINQIERHQLKSFSALKETLPSQKRRSTWINAGGQLIPKEQWDGFLHKITTDKIKNWEGVHNWYASQSQAYEKEKLAHSWASMKEILNIRSLNIDEFLKLLDGFLRTKEWMMKGIHDSRLKDYTSPFRKMTYENEQEMEIVTGKFSDNTFILQQQQELEALKKTVQKIKLQFKRNQKG